MKKIAIASLIAFSTLVAQGAFAQSSETRDRAIARLTDSRDMSTGLSKDGPGFTSFGMLGGSDRDRMIARLTDSRDQSTGFIH